MDRDLGLTDALAQLSFLVHACLERRAAEHELSIVQTRLLGILRDRIPTMNELGRLLGLDKSSVSGLVARAEHRGLVARTASADDGRVVHVQLTPAGRRLIRTAAKEFEADMAALVAELSLADRASLSRTISRILDRHASEHGVDLFATRPR